MMDWNLYVEAMLGVQAVGRSAARADSEEEAQNRLYELLGYAEMALRADPASHEAAGDVRRAQRRLARPHVRARR